MAWWSPKFQNFYRKGKYITIFVVVILAGNNSMVEERWVGKKQKQDLKQATACHAVGVCCMQTVLAGEQKLYVDLEACIPHPLATDQINGLVHKYSRTDQFRALTKIHIHRNLKIWLLLQKTGSMKPIPHNPFLMWTKHFYSTFFKILNCV